MAGLFCCLAKFREAMKEQGRRTDFLDNVKEVSSQEGGNSKAYTCELPLRPAVVTRWHQERSAGFSGRLCKEDRELHGLLVKHRPSTNGSNQHQKRVVNNVNNPPPKRAMGNTRAYIEQRLQALSARPVAENGECGKGRRKNSCDNVTANGRGNSAEYRLSRMVRDWRKTVITVLVFSMIEILR